MITEDLLKYIKQQKQKGVSDDDIRIKLLANGWQEEDIEEAAKLFKLNQQQNLQPQVPPPPVEANALASQPEPMTQPIAQPAEPIQPVSQEQAASISSYEATSPAPKGGNKKVLMIAAVALGTLIIAGGSFGYVYYSQLPEVVAKKMAINFEKVKTFEYAGNLTGEVVVPASVTGMPEEDSKETAQMKFTSIVNFSGSVDGTDVNNPKASHITDVEFKSEQAGVVESIILGVETRFLDKALYIQLTKAPELPFFDLSSVKNQWVKIDLEEIMKEVESSMTEEEKQRLSGGLESQFSQDQINKINAATQKWMAKTLKKVTRLPAENIDGVNTYHYSFTVNKTDLRDFILEVTKITTGIETDAQAIEAIDKSLALIDFQGAEIWVGKKDSLPRRLYLSFSFKEEKTGKVVLTEVMNVYFKNYNKPVKIEAPEKSTPLQDFMEQLFARPKRNATTYQVIRLMEMIRPAAEISFGEVASYDKVVCTSEDTTSDMGRICNAIFESAGSYPIIKKPKTKSSEYCVYIKLPKVDLSDIDKYYCVDSLGAAKSSSKNPGLSDCTDKKFSCPLTNE